MAAISWLDGIWADPPPPPMASGTCGNVTRSSTWEDADGSMLFSYHVHVMEWQPFEHVRLSFAEPASQVFVHSARIVIA